MTLKKSLILIAFMTLTITTDIFSNENTSTYYEYENIKFHNSIDMETIDQIPIEVLETMKNSEGIIKSLSKEEVDFENSEPKTKFMSTSDFSMYVWVEDLVEYTSNDEPQKFRLNAQGTWHTNPFYEFTDVIALSWSDEFTLENESCTIDGSNSRTSKSVVGLEKGIAYEVDLQLGAEDKVILLTADVYKFVDSPSTNNADVSGEYGHIQIKPSKVSLNFNEDNSIPMSVSFGTKLTKALPSSSSFTY